MEIARPSSDIPNKLKVSRNGAESCPRMIRRYKVRPIAATASGISAEAARPGQVNQVSWYLGLRKGVHTLTAAMAPSIPKVRGAAKRRASACTCPEVFQISQQPPSKA